MLLNFSRIRTQKVKDPVAKHFCQKNHCVKNFKVIGIEKTGNGDKIYRETKESLWIKKTLKKFVIGHFFYITCNRNAIDYIHFDPVIMNTF